MEACFHLGIKHKKVLWLLYHNSDFFLQCKQDIKSNNSGFFITESSNSLHQVILFFHPAWNKK